MATTSSITGGSADTDGADATSSAGFWPSLLDRQRAVIASACTYHNAPWCRPQLMMEHLHFNRVLFPDHTSEKASNSHGVHNLVLAVAVDANLQEGGASDDTLFVAFPGTQTFADLLLDLDINHYRLKNGFGFLKGGVPGQYHGGFIQRLEEIFPSMLPLCEFIREQSISRLIFCGHSLGGALAHLALIKFVVTTSNIPWLYDYLREQPMSIAFGSPHFCDAEAVRDFINLHSGLSRHMFTFIHEGDPVPRLLEDLEATKQAIMNRALYDVPRGVCASLWQCLMCARPLAVKEDTGRTRFWKSGVSLCAICRALYNAVSNMDPSKSPRYVWAGLTWPDLLAQPQPALELSSDALQCHNMGSYVALLCPILHPSTASGNGLDAAAPPNMVRNIGPRISRCVMRFEGKHEIRKLCKIVLEGENLSLCHRWCVSTKLGTNHMSRWWRSSRRRRRLSWSLERCTDLKVVLNLENEVDDAMISFLTGTALAVFIATPFGVSRECSVDAQDPWFDSCVKCVMSCGLAKLLLMRSCGQPALTKCCSEALAALVSNDDIVFKAKAGSFTQYLEKAENQHFEAKFDFVWERYVEPVIEVLRKRIKVPKAALTSINAGSAMGRLFPWCPKWVSYRTCLELLFQAIQTSGVNEGFIITPGRKQTSFFEYEMHAHWEQINKILAEAHHSSDNSVQSELLKKGKIIHNMFEAHDFLGKVRTVVFVGPKYAGKGTLIQCLLDYNNVDESVEVQSSRRRPAEAEVGGRIRRGEPGVEAFAMQLQWAAEGGESKEAPVMLVKVPGSWKAERPWEQLVHVPDLVVVVVSFAGETWQQAERLAEAARRLGRCSNILVVVNGMDRVLHGNPNSLVWKKYNPQSLTTLQQEFSRRSNVPVKNVLMCVADETLEETTLRNLHKLSKHVQFRNDITATLRQRIQDLPHHHHCWGPSNQISLHH